MRAFLFVLALEIAGLLFGPFLLWVFCLCWQYPPFADAVVALVILLAIGFGAYKLLDRLYRLWAGGGMNRM